MLVTFLFLALCLLWIVAAIVVLSYRRVLDDVVKRLNALNQRYTDLYANNLLNINKINKLKEQIRQYESNQEN